MKSKEGDNNQTINIKSKIYDKDIKVKIYDKTCKFNIQEYGYTKILRLPIEVKVEDNSFLHIGGPYDPRSAIKGQIFKVDGIPVIPATSFKGALRFQLEHLFINNLSNFKNNFNVNDDNYLKPCIPTTNLSPAERELVGKYYRQQENNNRYSTCYLEVEDENIRTSQYGICPVCYFMGALGLPGFLRFTNFYPLSRDAIIPQTNIRLDRKTNTAAHGAKVEQEQVKGGVTFNGHIDIILENPVSRLQCITFGMPRVFKKGENQGRQQSQQPKDIVLDKWLERWNVQNNDIMIRIKTLIEDILIPSIDNIRELGGHKSRGAGRVITKVSEQWCTDSNKSI
ncbi:MAG: RAMP superfamily CRISPR-associated protein [Candidatus Nitrosocaldaceae archaeon]